MVTEAKSAGSAQSSNLATWILLSAVLGLVCGIAVGNRAAVLQPLGIAYSKMLEISVFPYLICSLLVGLGGLARDRAPRLLKASWPAYLLFWALTFATILLLGSVVPRPPLPSLVTPETSNLSTSLIDLLIPANLIQALQNDFIPAIVIFSILFGIAIQAVPQKAAFLETMEVLRKASVTIWMWVVYFAPIGVFALFASTAGTVNPQVAGSLLSYMGLFLLGSFGLAFLVLPIVLRRLVPLSYREMIEELRPAITLALVTTLSAAALPQIQRAAERLLATQGIEGDEAKDVIRATLSISYVLCQLGNYFIALFVIYLSYHFRIALDFSHLVLLPPMTLLAGIGSPSASVEAAAFLSQWLNLPAGSTDLYVETMTVTRYGQVAVSVMGFACVTLVVPMIYFGRTRFRLQPILPGLLAAAILFGGIAIGGRILQSSLFPPPSDAAVLARSLSSDTVQGVEATILRARPQGLTTLAGAGSLDAIRARGFMRVGYGVNIMPFSYFNARGDLVGYDVAAAYRLARDLHVAIELVPVDWSSLEADLAGGRYDIIMAGAYATADRLRNLDVSAFYLTSPIALIVPSEKTPLFRDYDAIAARKGLKLAVFRDPVLEPLVHSLFPQAEITLLTSYDELPDDTVLDGALWTAEQAASWTAARTGYTAVVPENIGAPLPFSYLMPKGSHDLARYVDLWMALETAEGTRDREMAYWLRGQARPDPSRRWNLLDNVIAPLWAKH
ncbi:cation:dicarboxylate symporter family transporter [Rhodoligotrophos ferricapiens]|uniref:cation:dicarboxylate symporter family transporter n=1 Tax=Rhodoligotrophos ferricapiens TaxID=3069264 RepID=UPI00315D411C